MKRVSSDAALNLVVVVVVMASLIFISQVKVAEAVTCSPTELSACAAAVARGVPPSTECCNKLKEQRPCLCGYVRDPNIRQYINNPNAKMIAATCGVPFPHC